MMKYFNEIFHNIPRQGPGTTAATTQAWQAVTSVCPQPETVLDVGCGSGASTLCLADLCSARITAVDNSPAYLEQLMAKVTPQTRDRIQVLDGTMTGLPFEPESFDVIWAEGSLYIMGIEEALRQLKRYLNPDGAMAFTELVWFTDNRPEPVHAFWQGEYPDMQSTATRLDQIKAADYELVEHFRLPQEAWLENYFAPMAGPLAKLKKLADVPEAIQVATMMEAEIDAYKQGKNFLGYEFFIIKA